MGTRSDQQMIPNDPQRARFGPYEVDLHTHELWKFGTRLKLVGQPFEILAVLLSRPGELVTREELHSRLWPADTFVDFNHGLNAAVNKLREALSDSAENPRYIETLPRRGYRFIAKVEWLQPHIQAAAQAASNAPAAIPEEPAFVVGPAEKPPALELATGHLLSRYLIGAGVLFSLLLTFGFIAATLSGYKIARASRPVVERTRPLLSISDTSAPSFSPDGNSVAFYRQRSSAAEAGIYVSSVGSGEFVQLTSNDDDCCPVWSPDGRWIAFSREHDHQYSIHLAPADGGGEQKLKAERLLSAQPDGFKLTSAVSTERTLDTHGVMPRRGEIDWSPDGKSIVFGGPNGLYVLSVEDSAVHRVTQTPPNAEDWGPAFSPDGQILMFVRTHQIGAPEEILTVSGGETPRLLSEPGQIASPPRWSSDGKSVIFSSNRTGHPALWRATLDAPDSAAQISEAGAPAWDPTVSRHGYRLAYERLLRSLSIWQMNLAESHDKHPYLIVSSTSDTDQGPGPQFSPDGQKLAYMSDRNGTMEIWISNRDGSNAFQLTAVGGAGTPRWSPDSQAVAFDVTTPNGSKIVSINLHGGAPQVLTQDSFHSVCPSWSRDGKWIYFGSTRSGQWQVWKMPAQGGAPLQVTRQGGHAALESFDGKYVYYSKTPQAEPEIWRVPVNGGAEQLVPLVRPGTWASWQVVEGGILFIGPALGHQAVLSFYDFAKDRTTIISALERTPFWLGATPDGKIVAFDQPGREQAQAMLVENFR
jgi:Tol biopolymer transport system component/DNA-binding winged helix-turn-helix (wHTH) protein